MLDNKSVMNHVNELQVLVSKLKDLKVKVCKQLHVAVIIATLSVNATWYSTLSVKCDVALPHHLIGDMVMSCQYVVKL